MYNFTDEEPDERSSHSQGDHSREKKLEAMLFEALARIKEHHNLLLQSMHTIQRANRFRDTVAKVVTIDEKIEIQRQMELHDTPYDREAMFAQVKAIAAILVKEE